jgi:pSer/pThr/pTyr-binding forkhead associated (FHA) protein
VEVQGRRVVIGRGGDADLVLGDPAVSHRHAAISAQLGSPLVIEDLGSANGTYVNGRALRAPIGFGHGDEHPKAELRGGDLLRMGDTIAIVSLLPPDAS